MSDVAAYKASLLTLAGGALSAEDVRSMLGYASTHEVLEAVAARRLLALELNGANVFPAFQFEGGGTVPGVAEILSATPNTGPWELLQYMVKGDEGLGSDLPMDLVHGSPDEIERAVRFARTLEV